jgi:hypothetical protein
MDGKQVVFVVYNPPRADFPYLSAVFVPGKAEPMVTPFKTAAEAEVFNINIATEFAKVAK